MLYFIDNTSPIHLFTDASERGYGGYLYQVVNGEEKPIAFVSKSVSGSEVNWSTVEKECYAIYHSIRELEHLLKGRHFILHTDHKNLLKLMGGGSKKVHAWKLAIAMYDFKIEYVKGEDNAFADSMSRLCSIRTRVMPDPTKTIPRWLYKAISAQHNSHVGHWGVDRTLELVKESGVEIEALPEYVKKFVRDCPICQKETHDTSSQSRLHSRRSH